MVGDNVTLFLKVLALVAKWSVFKNTYKSKGHKNVKLMFKKKKKKKKSHFIKMLHSGCGTNETTKKTKKEIFVFIFNIIIIYFFSLIPPGVNY